MKNLGLDRSRLDAFITKIMAPVDDRLDASKKRLSIRAEKDVWHRACTTMRYHKARMDYYHAERSYQRHVMGNDAFGSDHSIVEHWRQAVVEVLLTPAPQKYSVAVKRRLAKLKYLPLSPGEIEDAIARDEEMIASRKGDTRNG